MSTQHVVVLDADGNPPEPVPYTLTADPPEGGPWYVDPVPSVSDRIRAIVDQFRRECPDMAALLAELEELTDSMDGWALQQADPPQTYSASSTDGEWITEPNAYTDYAKRHAERQAQRAKTSLPSLGAVKRPLQRCWGALLRRLRGDQEATSGRPE